GDFHPAGQHQPEETKTILRQYDEFSVNGWRNLNLAKQRRQQMLMSHAAQVEQYRGIGDDEHVIPSLEESAGRGTVRSTSLPRGRDRRGCKSKCGALSKLPEK